MIAHIVAFGYRQNSYLLCYSSVLLILLVLLLLVLWDNYPLIHHFCGLDIVRKIILSDSPLARIIVGLIKVLRLSCCFLITDELNSCCSRIAKPLFFLFL